MRLDQAVDSELQNFYTRRGRYRTAKTEVEAEAVAYVVGRYYSLDTSGSAFYLAAWESDNPEIVREHFDRISTTAEEIIDALNSST